MVCIYIIELKTRYKSVYAYDDGGSLSQVEYRSDDNNAYRVGFTYDRYGRRKRVSRMAPGSAGAVTTTVYSYNTMHRLLTLRTNGSDGSAISARRYTYDNVGNITQLRDIVTGMVHNYSYDGYYQLTGGSGQATDNTGNAYYGITVDYDRMHRPVAKNQQMGQTGMLFPGDVTVGYGLNYNYSATHKFRLESVYRHHFRSEADVMVEGDVIHDVCRFSYDYNGNMTGIVTDRPAADGHTERRIAERKLLWDEENRLRAVDDNGLISCYFYDHTGRRTIKLTGGGHHTYVNGSADTDSTDTRNCTIYPGPNTVFSFSDGAYRQGRLSRHIYAGNERILTAVSLRKPVLTSASGTSRRPFEAQKDTLQSLVKQIYADCGVPFKGSDNTAPSAGPVVDSESVYFYHHDHLGSTTLLTDATGCPTQRVEYAPFGELFLDRRDGTTWHTPYLFNAKELDEETGLYYYGARYYDPHLSLWISPDKLELANPEYTTYSYCTNRPVITTDLDGNWGFLIPMVKGIVGGAIDLGAQISVGMANGMTFTEAFNGVDWTSVGASIVLSVTLSPGMTTSTKVVNCAVTGADIMLDVETNGKVLSVGGKIGENKSIEDIAFDVVGSILPTPVKPVTKAFTNAVTADLTAKSAATLTKTAKEELRRAKQFVNGYGFQIPTNAIADYSKDIMIGQFKIEVENRLESSEQSVPKSATDAIKVHNPTQLQPK